jgi:plasmid stabilization system protein ParE
VRLAPKSHRCRFRLSALAEQDLEEIWSYVAEDASDTTADRLLDAIFERFDLVAVKGRRITGVTDKQVRELGISITPQHPERELRAAGALYESDTAFRDIFAGHVATDGRLVTGQNQNDGAETAWKLMEAVAKGAHP